MAQERDHRMFPSGVPITTFTAPSVTIASTTMECPNQHSQVHMPEEYQEFLDVFIKNKAKGFVK